MAITKTTKATPKTLKAKEKAAAKAEAKKVEVAGKYFYAVGRRKSAIATVRLFEGSDSSSINGKSIIKGESKLSQKDFHTINLPLNIVSKDASMFFTAKVIGGGMTSQIGAISLGIARALVKYDESLKKLMKQNGFLTRDPREVERKKVGLKKARKGPRFSKR